MPIVLRGLTLELDEPESLLRERAARRLRVPPEDIRHWAVVRRSIDAREKGHIRLVYAVEAALSGPPSRERQIVRRLHRPDVVVAEPQPPPTPTPGTEPLPERPLVVGFGPAGMFAAWMLACWGYRPVVLERGADVTTRHRDILLDYYRRGVFHPESNLLFGEGGAGAYSDGKLYTRVRDPRNQVVLETLVRHGADPAILIDAHPHVGSDKLPGICRRIRLHIESLGGQVRFGARLDDVSIRDGRLTAVCVNGETIRCGPVILAVGHSARDTLRMLARRGVGFQIRPFQMGARIEHPQSMVDRWQYGALCGHARLPPAEYSLVARGAAGAGKDLFSFCMCPGGMILPTHESPGLIATNGASRSGRRGPFANAGLVVTLDPGEVYPPSQSDPLAAFDFIEAVERTAFRATGESGQVPAQRASDFLAGRASDGALQTTFPLGGRWADLRAILPPVVADALARGLRQLDAMMPGFAGPQAILTAPESRASGPVRIPRDSVTRQACSVAGLYPVGEGAGYAGGIVSAACDGLKTAEALIARYAPPPA